MGYVEQLPSGKWRGVAWNAAARKRAGSKTFSSREEVDAWWRRCEGELDGTDNTARVAVSRQMRATVRDWARFYASRTLTVLPLRARWGHSATAGSSPCPNRGKHPLGRLVPRGQDDATTDVEVLDEWFSRCPPASPGVRPPAGVMVLDLDPRSCGNESLARLESEHGALPVTLETATCGGGRHLWFGYAGRSVAKWPGLDVNTSTGCVVVAPSLHESGHRYRRTREVPTVPAPRWLRVLLDPPRPVRRLVAGGVGLPGAGAGRRRTDR